MAYFLNQKSNLYFNSEKKLSKLQKANLPKIIKQNLGANLSKINMAAPTSGVCPSLITFFCLPRPKLLKTNFSSGV